MLAMEEDGENNTVDVDADTNTDTDEWWIDFVAGWISGAVSVVVCQPVDTVLTRLQAGPLLQVQAATTATATATTALKGGIGGGIGGAGAGSRVGARRSELAILATNLISLTRQFGIFSLWKGASPMIGAVPFQNALLMGGYGFGKRYSESGSVSMMPSSSSSSNNNNNNNHHDSSILLPIFMGGCMGGIVQSFLMSPVEWVKVNQQISLMKASTSSTTVTSSMMLNTLYRHKQSLWNLGLSATLLRDGIPHGVWFVSYEYCKIQMMMIDVGETSDDRGHNDNNSESSSSSSSSSSSFYKTVTVPIISGAFAATTAWVSGFLRCVYSS